MEAKAEDETKEEAKSAAERHGIEVPGPDEDFYQKPDLVVEDSTGRAVGTLHIPEED